MFSSNTLNHLFRYRRSQTQKTIYRRLRHTKGCGFTYTNTSEPNPLTRNFNGKKDISK